MKPIESALMEPDNPRIYRLVLTGGMMVIKLPFNLMFVLRRNILCFCSVNGKSRGFLTHSVS